MLSPVKYILVFLLLISYGVFGYIIKPGDVFNTTIVLGVAFAIYFYLIGFTQDKNEVSALLWFSMIFRVVFLFSIPILSSDYIRFLFDGKLMLNGVNPYLYQPAEILSNQTPIDGSLFGDFFSELITNHKYSLAFPLVQYAKVIPAYFIEISPIIGLIILRIPILIADFVLFKFLVKLLDKLNLSYNGVLVYALNPLVIIGLMANISFIGVMLCLFVVGLYYLIQNKWIHSLIFIAVSSVSSIFTILLLPLIFKKIGLVRSMVFVVFISIMLIVCSLPFYQEGIFELLLENLKSNISSSPINFGLANVFDWFTGKSHIIIPTLFLVALFSISISRANDWISVIKGMMFCVTTVILLSFNIKPHYFIILLIFSTIIQQYHYAILWSLIAFINYPVFTHQLEAQNWIMPVEFSLLLVLFLLELFGKTKKLTE